jgi:hypothetical protein
METIGQYLIYKVLPAELQQKYAGKTIGNKELSDIESYVGRNYPADKFREVLYELNRIGAESQGSVGGFSPNITHFVESDKWKEQRKVIRKQIQKIYHLDVDEKLKQTMVNDFLMKISPDLVKETYEDADKENSPASLIIKSGLKGKPANLNNIKGSPLMFADASGKIIPIPILNGLAKGLSPMEFWASSYGTRKGMVDTKLGVAKGGFMSKNLVRIAHRAVVTDDDDIYYDGSLRGLPVNTDDDDNIGALLASDTGGYKRNQIITAKVLRDIKRQGIQRMLVRSPMVGGPQDGSLYAKDAGIREKGRLPVRGENPGVSAAQALGEPISQSLLCLAEGTLVRMADRTTKKIEDIRSGDKVIGVSDEGVASPAVVTEVFNNGLRQCFRSTFRLYNSETYLECTREHKILTDAGIVPLKEAQRPKCIRKITYEDKGMIEPSAFLLGLLYSSVVRKDKISFAAALGIPYQMLFDSFEAFGMSLQRTKTETAYWLPIDYSSTEDLYKESQQLFDNIWDWNTDSLKQALLGLLCIFGSFDKGITFRCRQKSVADAVAGELLWKCFGIRTSPVSIEMLDGVKKMYSFAVLDTELFLEEFPAFAPLVKGKKKREETFEKVMSYPIGERKTYDIAIDTQNHIFLLDNGLCVSNSSKHSAGVVGTSAKAIGGFDAINKLIETPDNSPLWASQSSEDGIVQKIEEAQQGGHYVFVNNIPHYVAVNKEIFVKSGDRIEAGDVISEGLPNPDKVVEHKGIGEGRRYFLDIFMKTLKNSGVSANRRNAELIARGLVNHVELEEEFDDYVPGDKVPYNMLEKYWNPREDSKEVDVDNASGKYIEKPVLHYTIGTLIRPSTIKMLKEYGVKSVLANDKKPPFRSVMIRGAAIAQNDPDWGTAMYGSGIKSKLLQSVWRNASSDPKGTSYLPAVAFDKEFGTKGYTGKIKAPLWESTEDWKEDIWDTSDDDD